MPSDNTRIVKQVLALAAADRTLTHAQLGQLVSRSTKTIQRILKANSDVIAATDDKLITLQRELTSVITVKQRAEKYAELAKSAKNEAVSLGALQRIDDIDGILVKKEELRLKQDTAKQHQPMFMLPPGTSVNVTVNQVTNAPSISSGHEDSITCEAREVTPDEGKHNG